MKLCFPCVSINNPHAEKIVFERKLCGNKITCYFVYPIPTRLREKGLLFILIYLFLLFISEYNVE